MRFIILLLLVVSLIGCSNKNQDVPVGFVKRRVMLVKRPYVPSPAGSITLNVPAKYDTLLVWLDASDNQMSHRPKYRFTNSKGCLLQESGFFKRVGEYCKDTLDRLTIETSLGFDDEVTLANLDRIINYWDERAKIIGGYSYVWKAKGLQVINGRTFGILESLGPGNLIGEPYEQVSARVKFRQGGKPWVLVFNFDCKQRDCRDFIKNSYEILRSIRIDTIANTIDK